MAKIGKSFGLSIEDILLLLQWMSIYFNSTSAHVGLFSAVDIVEEDETVKKSDKRVNKYSSWWEKLASLVKSMMFWLFMNVFLKEAAKYLSVYLLSYTGFLRVIL